MSFLGGLAIGYVVGLVSTFFAIALGLSIRDRAREQKDAAPYQSGALVIDPGGTLRKIAAVFRDVRGEWCVCYWAGVDTPGWYYADEVEPAGMTPNEWSRN